MRQKEDSSLNEIHTWLFKTIEDTSKEFQIRLIHNLNHTLNNQPLMNDLIADNPNNISRITNTPLYNNIP
jgi:hypothetical protein